MADIHMANGVFPTETGKLQFYLEKYTRGIGFEGMDNGDEVDEADEQFATFMPPHEVWRENPLIEKYPLQFMSMRNRFTTHSQFYDVAWFREIMPEPILKLNPADAAARGISAGDTIRALTTRICCS
ncbi:MAG: molybdopterin dinucleotide binding domain-containing protein [Coriobacteriaceae bacterium]